jgi:dihydroxyacetone kinase
MSVAAAMVHATSVAMAAAAGELSRLDAVSGDGDLGVNIAAAFAAADRAVVAERPSDAAGVFLLVGRTFEENGSGSAGALLGAFFGTFGQGLLAMSSDGSVAFVDALETATDRVAMLGRSEVGDKTMLDALRPAVVAARAAIEAGSPLETVVAGASEGAYAGATATDGMPAKAGRARYAADRGAAGRDPGAVMIALMFRAWASALAAEDTRALETSP